LTFCEKKERKEEGREERKCGRYKHGTIFIFVATFNLVFWHKPCTVHCYSLTCAFRYLYC